MCTTHLQHGGDQRRGRRAVGLVRRKLAQPLRRDRLVARRLAVSTGSRFQLLQAPQTSRAEATMRELHLQSRTDCVECTDIPDPQHKSLNYG